jgi:hypothetical protein
LCSAVRSCWPLGSSETFGNAPMTVVFTKRNPSHLSL